MAHSPVAETVAIEPALRAMSRPEWKRLGAAAQVRARGLPGGVGWTDVINEAVARALAGSRQWRSDVPLVAFIAGIIRSIASEYRRQMRLESELLVSLSAWNADGISALHTADLPASQENPEKSLAVHQLVDMLTILFASDQIALYILHGLADGASSMEIRHNYRISKIEYDTARRRIRRKLARSVLA